MQAVYITLLIVLAFVVLAVFDTNRLARTWTGLSAGLLSFSFIFGNSIRQARPPSTRNADLCTVAARTLTVRIPGGGREVHAL